MIREIRATRRALMVGVAVSTLLGDRVLAETATPVATAVEGPLLSVTFDTLPAPPTFVRFVRILLEPGAQVPSHVHPGPEITLLERGSLTISADVEVVVRRAGEEAVRESGAITVAAGDAVIFPPGTPFGFRAGGMRPVSLLSLVLLPAGPDRPAGAEWVNGVPPGEQLAGVRSLVLGDAVAPGWPGSPIRVTLDVVVLTDGMPLPASDWPVMYAVDQGDLEFTLVDGELQLYEQGDPPKAITKAGALITVDQGGAVFFPGGSSELPRESAGEVVLLRIGFAGPEQAAQTAIPTSVAAAIPEGSTVITAENGVRLRSTAGTLGEIVAELPAGAALSVVGAPETVDGERWYPVAVMDASGASGFIAESFITVEP